MITQLNPTEARQATTRPRAMILVLTVSLMLAVIAGLALAVGERAGLTVQGIGLPVIYVFSHSDNPEDLTLLPDDEGGAFAAVSHLIQRGRKRIAHVTGPDHFEAVRLRQKGWLAAPSITSLNRFHLPSSKHE